MPSYQALGSLSRLWHCLSRCFGTLSRHCGCLSKCLSTLSRYSSCLSTVSPARMRVCSVFEALYLLPLGTFYCFRTFYVLRVFRYIRLVLIVAIIIPMHQDACIAYTAVFFAWSISIGSSFRSDRSTDWLI